MSGHFIRVTYAGNRSRVRPGDVFAFGGDGWISWFIKLGIRGRVSHVGIVLAVDEHGLLLLIESTTLSTGGAGVQVNLLSGVVKGYKGDVWHLPLSDENSARIASSDYFQYLKKQEGKPYGKMAALKSAIPIYGRSQSKKIFCSQLLGKLFRHVGIYHEDVNPAELTPKDICRSAIFRERYYQLKGDAKAIKVYNSDRDLLSGVAGRWPSPPEDSIS